MPMSDNERVHQAYDIIINNLKNNIKAANERTNNLLNEMENINGQLTQLVQTTTDPLIAQKFRELFNDPEILYYYQLLQVLRSIPKNKKTTMPLEPKK